MVLFDYLMPWPRPSKLRAAHDQTLIISLAYRNASCGVVCLTIPSKNNSVLDLCCSVLLSSFRFNTPFLSLIVSTVII